MYTNINKIEVNFFDNENSRNNISIPKLFQSSEINC